jgi:hypothetical protein
VSFPRHRIDAVNGGCGDEGHGPRLKRQRARDVSPVRQPWRRPIPAEGSFTRDRPDSKPPREEGLRRAAVSSLREPSDRRARRGALRRALRERDLYGGKTR